MLLLLSAVAVAAPLQLTAGVRDATFTRGIDAPRLGARFTFGAAALELAGFVNPMPRRYDSFDQTLVAIAHNGDANLDFQQPIVNDLGGLSFLIDFGFLELGDERFSGGPRLYAGLDVSAQRIDYLVYDEEVLRQGTGEPPFALEEGELAMVAGPVLGGGADFWVANRVGLRFTWSRRFIFQDKPQYDRAEPVSGKRLVSEPIRGLSLLVQL